MAELHIPVAEVPAQATSVSILNQVLDTHRNLSRILDQATRRQVLDTRHQDLDSRHILKVVPEAPTSQM